MEFHNTRYKKTLHENSKRSRNFKHAVLSYSFDACLRLSFVPTLTSEIYVVTRGKSYCSHGALYVSLPPRRCDTFVDTRWNARVTAYQSRAMPKSFSSLLFGLHLCKPFTWTLCPGPATVWIIHGHSRTVPPRCFVRQGQGEFLISFGRRVICIRDVVWPKVNPTGNCDYNLLPKETGRHTARSGNLWREYRWDGKNLPEYGDWQ